MAGPLSFAIRQPFGDERAWIEVHLNRSWGSTTVVSRGQAHDAAALPALVAVHEDRIVGLATFRAGTMSASW